MHFVQRLPAMAGTAALTLTFGAALAQPAEVRSSAPPTAAPLYRSVFDSYRPWRDESAAEWRKANDEMGRLGGHAGQLRDTTTAPASGMPPQTAGEDTKATNKEPRHKEPRQ
ncbi:MAG TPA: hypothetical protein VFR86_06390 [Burkholderiaceae bacterium]|nr:hypothetical protein [Burkholderiaceae bacterium]